MLLMRVIVPLLVVGLMSVSAGVAFSDSHGDGGNATTTDDGLATSTDDGLATSTDDGLATTTEDGLATTTEDGLATSTYEGDGMKKKAFVGIIATSTATSTNGTTTSITLTQNGTGEEVTIKLDGAEVKLPGGPNAWGSLEEAIAGGAEVVILTREGEDGNDAIFVLVKPQRPSHLLLVGTAIGTEDGVITLVLPNGKTKKVKKPKGDEDPEDGEVLTVIVENTGDGDGEGDADADGGVAETTGLVKASKIAERIESFLARLAAKDAELPQAAIDARQRLVANLAAVLERHSAQHVSIIEKASKAQGLGSGTAAGIQRALERAEAGQAKGNAIAADAKSKVGLGQNAGKGPKNILGPSNSGDGSDDDDGDGGDSGGSGKPDGSGKPANAGSQGSKGGNRGNSGG